MNLAARVAVALLIILAGLAVPAGAFAHGDKESDEAAALAMQPARALAQQAIALLRVRGDTQEAAMRLDAAVESKDKNDVDPALLGRAMETLDDGDPDRAVTMLDEALSRPLGSDSGKMLHEAGREFRPAVGAQEVVAIIVGAAALLLGLFALAAARRGSIAR